MKKYFFIAAMAFITLTLCFSCDKPSGQPKNDAENWRGIIEDTYQTHIKYLERKLQMAEYYASKDDPEGYQAFLEDLQEQEKQIASDFKNEHEDEFDDIADRKEYIIKQYQEKLYSR